MVNPFDSTSCKVDSYLAAACAAACKSMTLCVSTCKTDDIHADLSVLQHMEQGSQLFVLQLFAWLIWMHMITCKLSMCRMPCWYLGTLP